MRAAIAAGSHAEKEILALLVEAAKIIRKDPKKFNKVFYAKILLKSVSRHTVILPYTVSVL